MEDGIFYYDDGRYRCPNVEHQRIGGNMEKLEDTLNWFFEGTVKVKVGEERLELTRDSTTIILTLPEFIGAQSEPYQLAIAGRTNGKSPAS